MPKRFTLINEGDLILADTSEDRKDAAKGIEIINKSNAHILSGLHTIHLREKTLCTIPGFKTYYVASKSFRNFARKYCEGIKVFSIKPSLLKYTHFAYPQNKSEQFMIVNFFNKIEEKKAILEKKIDILKKYKEGIFRIIKRNTVNYIKLGDFCDLYQPKTISQNLLKKNEKYPVYGANGIIGYYNDYNHETSQVIVGCRGNCGSIQLTNTKSWINGNAMVIKPLNNIKLIYLYYLIHTIRFDKIIEKSSVPQITRDKMKTIKIPANFDNKILDMLILLDKKIELLQKEVKVLKKIKLQLLNVLFI